MNRTLINIDLRSHTLDLRLDLTSHGLGDHIPRFGEVRLLTHFGIPGDPEQSTYQTDHARQVDNHLFSAHVT